MKTDVKMPPAPLKELTAEDLKQVQGGAKKWSVTTAVSTTNGG